VTEIDLLASGEVSATALVEACLERIGKVESAVGAFVTVTAERARAEAAAADAALAEGRSLGPLHGLPVGLKDNIDTAGILTTHGSGHFLQNVPTEDATVAARLKAAGAVLVGKLTMHELAYGATSQNEHTGVCRNPWDLNRIPGGSSGGSGAAVGADEVPVSLGTDTGGSVRIPGSLNGVVGLRPTAGRVPVRGIFPIAVSFDTCGPLARHAIDVARVLDVISGYDAADPMSVDHPFESAAAGIDRGVDGLRVGVPRGFFFAECDPEVEALVRAAADELARLGARVEEIDVPGAETTHAAVSIIARSDAYALHRERVAKNPERFGSEVLRRLRSAETITGADYAEAREEGRHWRRQVDELFAGGIDLVLTPAASIPAPLAEDTGDVIETTRLMTQLTYAWSLAGIPAASVPCGFTKAGLPVGVQLGARRWRDNLVLRAAHAYQQGTDWHERRPQGAPGIGSA
jgi:aspartyl-tRNA(Asn)/glutamyl-tRNA(Gln) amidotransferase subunit A